MSKEIFPPDPIPVCEEPEIDDKYSMTFMDYSDTSYSETSRQLLKYLESEYSNIGTGSTRSFIAHDSNTADVQDKIMSLDIDDITPQSFSSHILLSQLGNDVLIIVNLF